MRHDIVLSYQAGISVKDDVMIKQYRRILTLTLLIMVGAILSSVVSAASVTSTPAPVSGRNPGNIQQIIPADVLARVKLLSAELGQIRAALGKKQVTQSLITVSGAAPREVYFEAQALFEKANRLAYEVTGSHEDDPEIHSENLLPAHVWQLVDASLKRILVVRERLGIKKTPKEPREPSSTTPTDVFNAILNVNQQLNALLYRQVAPSDVFEQVTLAISYTERLLKALIVEKRIPNTPAFIADRTPADVYNRLVQCVKLLQGISKDSGVKMLSINVHNLGIYQATPSDVFDLSKIIVSEVRHLATLLPGIQEIQPYYPGYKTPSEVYQRAGILLKQLEQLKIQVVKHPSWLRNAQQETGS